MVPVSSYGSHGEKLKRQESENNMHASFHVKYKPRKVSAVRYFPKRFKQFATQISGPQNNDLVSVGTAENFLGHNVSASALEEESENNKHTAFHIKYKSRKVSAVRDFPKGFEQFATQISGPQNNDLVSVGTAENFLGPNVSASALEDDSIEPSEIDVVSGESLVHSEMHELPYNLELKKLEPMVSPGQEEVPQLGVELTKSSGDAEFPDYLGPSELESTDFRDSMESPGRLKLNYVSEDGDQVQQVDSPSSLMCLDTLPKTQTRASAIRCFPPECGNNVKNHGKEYHQKASSSCKNTGLVSKKSTLEPEPFEDVVRRDVKQVTKYSMGDSDDDSVEPFEIDVGSPTQQVDMPSSLKMLPNISSKMNIPQRKVSVIRSFPPGCGRNVAHLSRKDCEKALASSKNEGLGLEKFNVQHEPFEETVRGDVKKVTEYSAGDSEDDHIEPCEIDSTCQAQQVDRPTNLKILPKSSSKILIPHRRVSAIRDFPPGCGRNFTSLRKEDWEKARASSKSKVVNHKKPTLGNKPFEETVRNGVKQITEVAQGQETNLKEIFPGKSADKVQPKCKGDDTETVKKETQPTNSANIKSERIDSKENCVNLMHGSELHHSESKSQTIIGEADGDDWGSAGKRRKDLSNNIKDKNIKLSGASSNMNQLQGLQQPVHRVIVQALMAAPRCPWRQSKRAFKCNPASSPTGRKRKKHLTGGPRQM